MTRGAGTRPPTRRTGISAGMSLFQTPNQTGRRRGVRPQGTGASFSSRQVRLATLQGGPRSERRPRCRPSRRRCSRSAVSPSRHPRRIRPCASACSARAQTEAAASRHAARTSPRSRVACSLLIAYPARSSARAPRARARRAPASPGACPRTSGRCRQRRLGPTGVATPTAASPVRLNTDPWRGRRLQVLLPSGAARGGSSAVRRAASQASTTCTSASTSTSTSTSAGG